MNVLDLFSGIGGFSLGLERAGMKTVAFCEINERCRKVLQKHWPDVQAYDDIRTLDANKFRNTVDVICGGFPCKQTSVAAAIHGKRNGLEGKDSGLWHRYGDIVGVIRPVWVIVENPRGVKAWEGEITSRLEGFGYRVSRLALKASDFGLPHARLRYFYVANRNGERLEITRPDGSPSSDWIKGLTSNGGTWMQHPPGTRGIYDGVSNRMDRIIEVGNSICPPMSEYIGRAIMQYSN